MTGFLVSLGLVLAFVSGAWLAIRPSAESRRLASLRQEAMGLGLKIVRVSAGEQREFGEGMPGAIVWYSLCPGTPNPESLAVRRAGKWAWIRGGGECSPGIDQMGVPAGVHALRTSTETVEVAWDERDSTVLPDVHRVLRLLAVPPEGASVP